MAPISTAVFATLLMNDAYLPGAMVLGHSLKDRSAKAPLVAFVVIDRLANDTITELRTVYDDIVPIQAITNKNPANLYLMNRPDLISTFTKIELWRQTQYKRIIYMDADMVALRAPNELLKLDTEFAAVPDIGWPDCFNTGLMVFSPNMGDYYSLLALAQRGISFDGADQGLLNMHFREWERLSFVYNCTPSGNYQYVPAYRHFQSSIAVVHFIGQDKPWTLGRDNKMNTGVYGELLGHWWSVYDRHYRSQETTHYNTRTQQSSKKVQDGQPTNVEMPLGDSSTPVGQNDFTPVSTVEQRRFSAPHIEWDPTRAPPPTHAKPEAANFPTRIYDMSSDTQLFQPPSHYPEAPKDMWYEVPQKPAEPEKPKPIFPWEARAPKPTRVFPRARAPSPPPVEEPMSQVEKDELPSSSGTDITDASEESVATPSDPWASFEQRVNAWDDMPEIERYVRNLSLAQTRKGNLQVLHPAPSQDSNATPPTRDTRRASLRLTDFPTEVERPSLPVTPAPIRRSTIWGQERDEESLPAAEGVPKQEDWNPVTKLEDLQRRQSEALLSPTGSRQLGDAPELPQREMPDSKSKEDVMKKAELSISPSEAPKKPKPILKAPHFELGQDVDESSKHAPGRAEEDLDPTEAVSPTTVREEGATES
ncbi:glycogenin glucosyltransferase [Exophiala viscosa]|uniref:glycogenin glucosyltransferase n=1 Tax=Exophiala viscosa TaxID=2486360 RepID=UPI0021966289|nr:glycogenin glucosyltransferase [Exophiala viscosa]